jgi:hypothetical protein
MRLIRQPTLRRPVVITAPGIAVPAAESSLSRNLPVLLQMHSHAAGLDDPKLALDRA